MSRPYKLAVLVGVLLCAAFVWVYLPRLLFGWHSRPEDVNHTKQTVLLAAQKLQKRAAAGLALPVTTNELTQVLGGSLPRDAWGRLLSYHRLSDSNFVISA
jgi:hypothetical protein